MGKALRLAAFLATMGLAASGAMGQSISLDDGGQSPATPAPPTAWVAVPYGNGAENQFGSPVAKPSVTLSPSLNYLQSMYPGDDNPYSQDGTIFTPNFTTLFTTFAAQVDAFSTNKAGRFPKHIRLSFSVDRLGQGSGALAAEAARSQQSCDIFLSTTWFTNPGAFAGSLAAMNPTGAYSGVLSSSQAGGTNSLHINETQLGLSTPELAPNESPWPGSHDNIDAFDYDVPTLQPQINPSPVYDRWSYFSTQPLEAQAMNALLAASVPSAGYTQPPQLSAADIFAVPVHEHGMVLSQTTPMTLGQFPVFFPLAFAQAPTLGLDAAGVNTDSVDGLILYDNGTEGVLEPGVDYALFSLAPGSAALAANSLSAGDVLFTDFSGHFGLYAKATDLGLTSGSNIDALEVPEPATLCVLLVGGAAGLLRRQRT